MKNRNQKLKHNQTLLKAENTLNKLNKASVNLDH